MSIIYFYIMILLILSILGSLLGVLIYRHYRKIERDLTQSKNASPIYKEIQKVDNSGIDIASNGDNERIEMKESDEKIERLRESLREMEKERSRNLNTNNKFCKCKGLKEENEILRKEFDKLNFEHIALKKSFTELKVHINFRLNEIENIHLGHSTELRTEIEGYKMQSKQRNNMVAEEFKILKKENTASQQFHNKQIHKLEGDLLLLREKLQEKKSLSYTDDDILMIEKAISELSTKVENHGMDINDLQAITKDKFTQISRDMNSLRIELISRDIDIDQRRRIEHTNVETKNIESNINPNENFDQYLILLKEELSLCLNKITNTANFFLAKIENSTNRNEEILNSKFLDLSSNVIKILNLNIGESKNKLEDIENKIKNNIDEFCKKTKTNISDKLEAMRKGSSDKEIDLDKKFSDLYNQITTKNKAQYDELKENARTIIEEFKLESHSLFEDLINSSTESIKYSRNVLLELENTMYQKIESLRQEIQNEITNIHSVIMDYVVLQNHKQIK